MILSPLLWASLQWNCNILIMIKFIVKFDKVNWQIYFGYCLASPCGFSIISIRKKLSYFINLLSAKKKQKQFHIHLHKKPLPFCCVLACHIENKGAILKKMVRCNPWSCDLDSHTWNTLADDRSSEGVQWNHTEYISLAAIEINIMSVTNKWTKYMNILLIWTNCLVLAFVNCTCQ